MSKPKKPAPATVALGWVGWEYDDGTQSVHTSEPGDYHATMRRVPAEVWARFQKANEEAHEAGKALLDAWTAAPELRNPKYVPDEDVHA